MQKVSSYIDKVDNSIVCHGCLAFNVKLFDMEKYQVKHTFSDLVGRQLNFMVTTQQYLCCYCIKLLINFNTFRERCTLALELLKSAHKKKLMTKEFIKITRKANKLVLPYTRSPVHTTDNILAYDFNHENEENREIHADDKNINEDNHIKCEFKSISDIEMDFNENRNSEQVLNEGEATKIETTSLGETKFTQVDDELCDTFVNEDSDDNYYEEIDVVKTKFTKFVTQKTNPKTKSKRKRLNHNVKWEELSKKLNMDIKLLSREEQIREIENRKLSSNYKQAKYKCNFCYRGYVIEETYNRHMTLHNDNSGDLLCDICKCRFKTKLRLSLHLKTHGMILTCKDCGHVSTQIRLATLHWKFHEGAKFPCEYCPKIYNRRTTYYWHLKQAHATSLLRCEICGDAFNGAFGLKAHERKTHAMSTDSVCMRCGLHFFTRAALDAHRNTQDGLCELELKTCVRCGSTFSTEELLKQHELEQQRFAGHFECSLCSKKYHTLAYYKKHFQKYHSATKDCSSNYRPIRDFNYTKESVSSSSILCEICGTTTKNNGLLRLHYHMKHSSKDRWPYQCNICPKRFRVHKTLQDHIRSHTGERPYQCQLCSKTFTCKQNLKRHNIVHTRERPHSCHICDKRFQTTSCVKVHVQSVHMKIPQPPRTRKKKSD